MPWLIAPLFPLARKNAFLIHVIIGRIEQHRRLIKRLYYMISIKMIKLGLHKIDLFVNCSRFTLETLVKNLGINPSKAVVVHPFLSWPYSIRGDSSSNLRSRPKRAVYLARIAPEKRHEVLKSLATQLPEYEFISAGLYQPIHYTYFEHLVNQLPSNYKVFLNLPPLEIKKLLENCRIYLHPAVNEPFALSIQEAISSGCIPLAHNSGGHLEYIPRELRWDSIKEAKDKIIRYMEEEFAVEDYEKRIYPQLLERLCEFTPESYWEKFSSIISELLGVDTHLGGH
jgi:glycosyltransferase involved in cell wall biosynthesis